MTDRSEQPRRMMELLRGYMVTKAIHVVAELGVADRLAQGTTQVDALAAAVGANPDALYRVMRTLATVGIFTESEPRTFALTPLGELLREGGEGAPSMRDLALLLGGDMYRAWSDLGHSVKTGDPAFDKVFGEPHFPYLDRHPAESRTFDRAMAIGLGPRLEAMLAFDWKSAHRVVDVGGGDGTLLTRLLKEHSHLRGTVFDRSQVASSARRLIAARKMADRCDVVDGDFFVDAPPGADTYVLSRVLHDWNDDRAGQILANVAAAMASDAVLLIVDDVLPPGDLPHPCKWIDLQMLAVTGGRERTEAEWRSLLASVKLALGQVLQRGAGSVLVVRRFDAN